MIRRHPLALLSAALLAVSFSLPSQAAPGLWLAGSGGNLVPTPSSMLAPASPPPVGMRMAPAARTLKVPVQVVHITVRHGGDREIRLVSSGTVWVTDGVPNTWSGESVQRYLRAPSQDRDHYTVSTDEVKAGETVTIDWHRADHQAHINVKTHGMGQPDQLAADLQTVPLDGTGSDVIDHSGVVIVGQYHSLGEPVSDRREIDAFVIGGSGGSTVDEVKVWDAVSHNYKTIGGPATSSTAD